MNRNAQRDIFLMHDDAISEEASWEPYLQTLRLSGHFQGGSAIGNGVCARKFRAPAAVSSHLTGFIRISVDNLDQAKFLLTGNPHFEAGGTVEIRELPQTD
jgi:hypothetical protein